jgi:hypothetical protein
MKRVVAALIVVLAVVAYIAGYWPEYQRRVALESEVASLRSERDSLDARARLARLLGLLLNVTEAVNAMNFGQAQTMSSTFFDDVRAEEALTEDSELRATLEGIHQNRDAVTSALARGDAGILATLHSMQIRLRQALGYPVPNTAPTMPPPPAAPATPTPDAPTPPDAAPAPPPAPPAPTSPGTP